MNLARFFSLLSQNGPLHPLDGVRIALLSHARGMQGLPVGGQNRVLTPLANEAGPDRVALTGISNELQADTADGYVLIPYGQWPHAKGLQRFGRAEADEMVGYFKNPWNRIKRALVGMPIFKGHPDLEEELMKALANAKDPVSRAGFEAEIASVRSRYPDKTVYGYILDMQAREKALALRLVLSESGASLVNEKGLTAFSPHWLAKELAPEDGKKVFAPVFMKSIGLTDRPNIAAVTSLVNSAPADAAANQQPNPTMNKLVLALLAALGRPLANEASEQQISEALTAAVPVATALLSRPEQTALANEQTAHQQATAKVVELTTSLANERTALANALAAHATTLVDHAVQAGRITEAQKPVWLGRLKTNFAAESVALANEAVKVKTTPRTENLGDRKGASEASSKFTALVNEAMPKHGNNWIAAWEAVKTSPDGKALYEQMNTKPAAAAAAS